MKRAICTRLIAMATVAAAAFPAAAAISSNIQKNFSVAAGGKLIVDTDLGDVEVRTSPSNSVSVQVFREARLADAKDAEKLFSKFHLKFEQKGNDIEVRGDYEDQSFFHLFDNARLNVRFVITVPSRYDVDVNTSGGDVSVADLAGNVTIKTSGGDLKIGRIDGTVDAGTSGGDVVVNSGRNITVKSSGGDLSVGHAFGPIEARTSGGNIKIEQADGSLVAKTSGGTITLNQIAGAVDANTSGGSISARITRQPNSNSSLSTSGGNVSVYLNEGIHLNLDADTSGGRVSTEMPVAVQGSVDSSSLDAKLNGGGPALRVRASGGNIVFHRAQ
ncbi:MAG TPA: DUF4097 family beta strand repeat-containing protein [Thermoanaerobaculia bacterium]|nr:DUF4097 family beta strand repeat-containing protein [Thermoanaerobaculia bacterium]